MHITNIRTRCQCQWISSTPRLRILCFTYVAVKQKVTKSHENLVAEKTPDLRVRNCRKALKRRLAVFHLQRIGFTNVLRIARMNQFSISSILRFFGGSPQGRCIFSSKLCLTRPTEIPSATAKYSNIHGCARYEAIESLC